MTTIRDQLLQPSTGDAMRWRVRASTRIPTSQGAAQQQKRKDVSRGLAKGEGSMGARPKPKRASGTDAEASSNATPQDESGPVRGAQHCVADASGECAPLRLSACSSPPS
mmetsp:Transcript_39915/g.79903  ORF Transcript_39915/g.79903 Transcript_39915/m.79903 type:complete len:110 (+) Transcript_39915:338-667(+)